MNRQQTIRFWDKVCKTETCWVWMGSLSINGYGRFNIDGRNTLAHRAIYFHTNPSADQSLLVCHKCDNKRCVNVAHMFLGTVSDNAKDMVSKGRNFVPGLKGEESPVSKLTESQAYSILEDTDTSNTVLAEQFGVGQNQIGRIRARKAWKHL